MDYTLKKSLGQHFLHDEVLCKSISETIPFESARLLEIGPGAGAITKYLLNKRIGEYICVELDSEKVAYLVKKYPTLENKIINDDFLRIQCPFQDSFFIIGNFPYNISSQIMFRVLEWREKVDMVVGMFQKEVAQRIASKEGSKNYGILSVLLQCYYDVEYLFDVPPMAFNPPPKVMSGVIRLTKKNQPLIESNHDGFVTFVKLAFNQRRKTLRNGLKSSYPIEKLQDAIFDKRAEQLSVPVFIELFQQLRNT